MKSWQVYLDFFFVVFLGGISFIQKELSSKFYPQISHRKRVLGMEKVLTLEREAPFLYRHNVNNLTSNTSFFRCISCTLDFLCFLITQQKECVTANQHAFLRCCNESKRAYNMRLFIAPVAILCLTLSQEEAIFDPFSVALNTKPINYYEQS